MWAKLALSRMPGTMIPRQLGPAIRRLHGQAASSIAWRSSVPCASAPSPKPAVMTTAALVPRSASSPTRPGTVSGGVAITARSGTTGRLATSG